MKEHFLLNPEITFLNHGSFGACPKPVFEKYMEYQRMLEFEPVQFMTNTGTELLEKSKKALGDFVNCDPDDLIYVTNPSTAGNLVIKSLRLQPGDEVLTTNQEYGAMDRTWRYYCRKAGAKYVRQEIALPLLSKEAFIEQFWKGLSPKTKIVFISQITSPTALIFPVREICDRAKELGLMTIVDGAHVPAHIPLDLQDLKADIYTGACHKWMLTPKGNSFLYVKKEYQDQLDPLIISWGYEAAIPGKSKYLDYHTWQGTRDFSAFLTTPDALKFLNDNNWEMVSHGCKSLILDVYPEACKVLKAEPICKVSDDFLGQMCSVPIQSADPLELKRVLYEDYKIEIPLPVTDDQLFIRISIQAYNTAEDCEVLFNALHDIKRKTNLLQ